VADIKELLEEKLSELIINLKNIIKNTYTKFIQKDQIIKNSFSPNVLEKIDFNLENIMPDLEKNYQNALEKYLKEKFISAFSDVLDQKTNYTLGKFYEEKNELKESLDEIFSSKEDKDLNEINKNINYTLESIQSYRKFLSSFKISENAKLFFINYSNNTLLPIFKKFNSDFNKKMAELIITTINSNSQEIEKLTPNQFIEKTKDIYNDLYENYVNFITRAIIDYGTEDYIYKSNLNRTIEKNINILGIYNTDNKELEIAEETKNRIASKYVEETLEQLVNKTRNIKQYVDNLNAFVKHDEIIQGYKDNINISNKNIKDSITQNKYNAEIEQFLREKLGNLTNILINYYDYINSNFCDLKNDIKDWIKTIEDSLDNCTDITKDTLNDEYQKISDSTHRINEKVTNYIDRYNDRNNKLKYVQKSENMMVTAIVNIQKLTEYAEFKLDLTLEGVKFKVPKVKAKIIDKTIPKNVKLNIATGEYGYCHNKSYEYNIIFNDGNFTYNIEYDIKSSYINITTYTDIEKYNYTMKKVEINGIYNETTIDVWNYEYNIICKGQRRTERTIGTYEVPAQKSVSKPEIINI
jgi:hypothetical protein